MVSCVDCFLIELELLVEIKIKFSILDRACHFKVLCVLSFSCGEAIQSLTKPGRGSISNYLRRKLPSKESEHLTYLHHGGENISEGNENKIVQSCGVGNLGQVLASLQA